MFIYSDSYKVTLFNKLFSEKSCSVTGLSEKMDYSVWIALFLCCRLDSAFCSRTVTSWQECADIRESPSRGKCGTKSSCVPRADMDEHVRHPIRLLRQLCRGGASVVRVVQLLLHD